MRLEREGRSLSLANVEAVTKIQIRHLEALERGDLADLPGGVFRKGILRAYLRAVDLDEVEWINRFDLCAVHYAQARGGNSEDETAAWAMFASNVKRNRSTIPARQGLRWAGILALLFLLIGAAWVVWRFELHSLSLR